MTDFYQLRSRKMREIKQELSVGEENEGDFAKSITSNHFNYLLTAIKQEDSSSLGEDGEHLIHMTYVTCQVKTEPQSEEEDGCELANTPGDYPDDFLVKREISIEVDAEDHPMMDNEEYHKQTTIDEDSGTDSNHVIKSENDNWPPNFPHNNIDKQKNICDPTREISKQQIYEKIGDETEISPTQTQAICQTRKNRCSVCAKAFRSRQACLMHIWKTHTGKNPYTCEVCRKGFKYLSILQVHKAVHSDERPFSCDACNKTFKQKCYLRKHKESCHSDERPYPCDVCNKAFKQKSGLKKHKMSCHSNERPYSCDLCDKAFKSKCVLQNHKRSVHSDKRPYSCDGCNKAFKQKCVLQRHNVLCHSVERCCDSCDKAFKQKSVLQDHKVLCHSDERPYSCDLCGKAIKSESGLQNHKRLAHPDAKPYSCNVCNKAFKQMSALQMHKVLCHSLERCCDMCDKGFKQVCSSES